MIGIVRDEKRVDRNSLLTRAYDDDAAAAAVACRRIREIRNRIAPCEDVGVGGWKGVQLNIHIATIKSIQTICCNLSRRTVSTIGGSR